MKFLTILAVFFGVIYLALAVHFFSFDYEKKADEIAKFSKSIKDVKLSTSFENQAYKDFVYAK
ncbi:MAG: hypothetical protein K5978_07340 [Campylobacter sp.]|nr:hypothetical protein [Campylobacter sp.]